MVRGVDVLITGITLGGNDRMGDLWDAVVGPTQHCYMTWSWEHADAIVAEFARRVPAEVREALAP